MNSDHVREDMERKIETLKHWMEEKEEEGKKVIIGRDFNAKTGERGRMINTEEEENK